MSSFFERTGGGMNLESLKALTGIYLDGEKSPYSIAVLDMISDWDLGTVSNTKHDFNGESWKDLWTEKYVFCGLE